MESSTSSSPVENKQPQPLRQRLAKSLRPEKLAVRISVGLAIVMVTYTALFSWFNWFYQEPAVVYNNKPFPIVEESKVIRAGEALQFYVERCSEDNYNVVMSRRLTDGIVWELPQQKDVFIEKGCHSIVRAFLDVPANIPPGEYHLHGELLIRIDWLIFSKMRSISYETNSFTIIK